MQHPEHARARILVEDTDAAWFWSVCDALPADRYDVVWCGGPEHAHEGCTLLADGTCTRLAGADLVLQSLDLTHWQSRAVLRALRGRVDPRRIALLVHQGNEGDWPELTAGCPLATFPISSDDLARFVATALGVPDTPRGPEPRTRRRGAPAIPIRP